MRCASLGLGVLLAACAPARAVDDVIDSPMYRDPDVPMGTKVVRFQKGLVERWVETLGRPDADSRTQAATALAIAKTRGVPGVEAALPALKRELDRDDQHPVVRLAVAKALVALDAKDAAPRFHALAATAPPDLVEVITPALAAWDYRPARIDWRAAIDVPDSRRRLTLLAMEALAAVKDEAAAVRLRLLALSPEASGPVRLAAARALSELRTAGLEADVRAVGLDPVARKVIDRLVAVTMLRRHSGDPAVAMLHTFVRDPEPSVAAIALGRLVELDPNLVLPVLSVAVTSPDANVRTFGVTVLDRVAVDNRLAKLADFTNDPHPAVRVQARTALHRLARDGQRDNVCTEAMRVLAGSDWRGQEQAAILLAQLDHKTAVPRLIEVLDGQRGETIAAAAWAVRKLDVPDSMPAVFNYIRGLTAALRSRGPVGGRKHVQPDDMDVHLCQLIQLLGKHRYRPADPALRELVAPHKSGRTPTPVGAESRAAAVWALGKIHEGAVDRALSRLFIGRLNAVQADDVEDYRIRAMSAIALARMKDPSAVEHLRKHFVEQRPGLDRVNNSCGWALEQLTGEKLGPPGVVETFYLDWFLRPSR